MITRFSIFCQALALLVCYFCFSYNTASAQNFATGSDCPTYYTGSDVNDEDYPIPSGTGNYSNSVICNQVSIQDLEAIVYPTIPTYNGVPLGAYNPDTCLLYTSPSPRD